MTFQVKTQQFQSNINSNLKTDETAKVAFTNK